MSLLDPQEGDMRRDLRAVACRLPDEVGDKFRSSILGVVGELAGEEADTAPAVGGDGGDRAFDFDGALAELHQLDHEDAAEVEPSGSWARCRHLLPAPVRDLLLACVRLDYVRDCILDRVHEEVLLQGVSAELMDTVTIRDAWRRACRPDRYADTRKAIRRVRDDVVRVLHLGSAYQHSRYTKLPTFLKAWKPEKGVLHVAEVGRTVPSIGYAPLMEATPPQLVRYVYERWLEARLATEDPSTLMRRKPHGWDLTAGAGTGHDALTLLGVEMRSSDLTSMNEAVATLDARNFMDLFRPMPIFSERDRVQRRAPRPDIILFDPPSRGRPTHSDLYWPDAAGQGDHRDFGGLDRQSWIETTTDIVRRLLPVLAPGGVVSFLVRHGVRDHGRVEADDELLDDVKAALGSAVNVMEEVVVEYGKNRVRQASLDKARVPATHLLLGRPT